jgi:hypothetical protein
MSKGYLKYKGIWFQIWLVFHKMKCSFWNGYLRSIDQQGLLYKKYAWEYWCWKVERHLHRKQHKKMGYSLYDFRLYVYLEKCNGGWL